ncbi:hypothetical protein [Natronococcus occultus]|uniref:Uncharacterized protein n=1 Tax=Natronococcus occultus SP4 TaxID=694430 RepID=L0K5I8_9EURY|nr:hypothetical protein [Natronococcus occultus]AGB39785.1 hypothetical protein Natoc_4365 [Natronococcus occultus SP4]
MPIPKAYRNKRNAPWNAPDAPECPDCEATVVDVDDHEDGCPIQKATPEELHRINEELAQPSYEPEGL